MRKHPLDSVRVVELSDYESVHYATRILNILGADVTKIERPSGDPLRSRSPFVKSDGGELRSIPFEYLNAGKLSVVIDTADSDQLRRMWEIVDDAAVVVITPEFRDLVDLPDHPRPQGQVRVLAGATGGRDPEEGPTSAFTRFHGATTGYLIPADKDRTARPAWSGPYAFEVMDGTALTLAILAELCRPAGADVDFSFQGFGVWMSKLSIARVALGQVTDAHRYTSAYPFGGTIKCSDGYACIFVIEEHQWRGMCTAIDRPEWIDDPRFIDGIARLNVQDDIDAGLAGWCLGRTVDEVLEAGRRGDFPVGRVRDPLAVLQASQRRGRTLMKEATTSFGSFPVACLPFGPSLQGRQPGRAPRLGEHTDNELARSACAEPPISQQQLPQPATVQPLAAAMSARSRGGSYPAPLEGLRVIDLTWAVAGPIATSFLAYLGADVVKVENRRRPDLMRIASKQYGFGGDLGLDNSPQFQEIGAGKRSIELDLRARRDRRTIRDLLVTADVVVENMRPGKMEELGLGYDALKVINPAAIMCSVSATGRVDGPATPGYAPIFWGEGGGSWLTGWPDRMPGVVRGPVDMYVGTYAAVGILAALHERARTGVGTYIDCSAIEAVTCAIGVEVLTAAVIGASSSRAGNDFPGMLLNDVFPCAGDDQWIAITILGQPELDRLRVLLGIDEPLASVELVRRLIAERTAAWDGRRLEGRLHQLGIAAAYSLSLHAAIREPRLTARHTWQRTVHPLLGLQLTIGLPWTSDGRPYALRRPAPLLGADTQAVCDEWRNQPRGDRVSRGQADSP